MSNVTTIVNKCFLFLQVDTVCHGDELPLLFHANLTSLGGTYTDKELTLVKEMQGYWANFAKQGAPASSGTYKSVLLDSVCLNSVCSNSGGVRPSWVSPFHYPEFSTHRTTRLIIVSLWSLETHHCTISHIRVLRVVLKTFLLALSRPCS